MPQTAEPPSEDSQDMDTDQVAQDSIPQGEVTATESSTAAVEQATPEVNQQPEVS